MILLRHLRWFLWSAALLGALLSALGYALVTPSFDAPGFPRLVCFSLMGIFGLGTIFLAPRLQEQTSLWLLLVLPALALRFLLLPVPVSDDVNRYVWEGQLVRSGISPYAHSANAPERAAYRDSYWTGMNHKDRLTAYPPLAQWTFALTTTTSQPIHSFKLFIMLADMTALAGIVGLLRRRGLPILYAAFYALNPVVLIAFAGEAHFDVVFIAALVWALWAHEAGLKHWAVGLAALATGLKWVALPCLPFFSRFAYLRSAAIAALVLGLPALFFWETLPQLLTGLLEFGGGMRFNGPIHGFLVGFLELSNRLALTLMLGIFAAVVGWRWWLRSGPAIDSHLRWIFGALLLCLPTVHFWYIAWILPFVCLRPSLPWLALSMSSGIYFLVWSRAADGTGWGLTATQQVCFWAPFAVACLYEYWSTSGRCVAARVRRNGDTPRTIAVIIPTLNTEAHLETALRSVAQQAPKVDEVIVVDGGSSDHTLAKARAAPLAVNLLHSEPGRGIQIARGIEAASAEWVIILHADAQLAPGSCERLLAALQSMPCVIGGAFGQRFAGQAPQLVPIEVLNDLRALFTRTSFGDQIQFFHRSSALEFDLMPKQPLMEDVESSWRVREQSEFLFLGHPGTVCHRGWQNTAWLKRFALVMRLVGRYRLTRLRNREAAHALSVQLYAEYYDRKKP